MSFPWLVLFLSLIHIFSPETCWCFVADSTFLPITQITTNGHSYLISRCWIKCIMCRQAARYFHRQLKGPAGEPARQYLAHRGVTGATVTRFGLGFAPPGWANLMDAMQQMGFSKEELLEAGLLSKNEQKGTLYDRFRNRLMFPILDLRGNVIGFGGRVMDDSTPKYLNSPETVIFNKRKNLFALNLARKSKQGYILLTEGYMAGKTLFQTLQQPAGGR